MMSCGISSIFAFSAMLTGPMFASAQRQQFVTAVPSLESLAPLVEQVAPAVVNIGIVSRAGTAGISPFGGSSTPATPGMVYPTYDDPFGPLGSGVIVDATSGLIVTNAHVVDNAETIIVGLRDGREFNAQLVGIDSETDIAAVRINAPALTSLPRGNSDSVRVGDFVVALGNPFGVGQTLTFGVVSGTRRSNLGIEGLEDFIQTDASINPGNSGGALVDLQGRLIGINSAILGPTGTNVGIGFAIPVNMAMSVVRQLVAFGRVRRGWLGIRSQDLTPGIADALGISADHAAILTRVERNSPAAEVGLRIGDVVLSVNGDPVRDAGDLRNKLGLADINLPTVLSILREGRADDVVVTLTPVESAIMQGEDVDGRIAGAVLTQLDRRSPQFGLVEGVMVADVRPATPAFDAGLQIGDVIAAINTVPVRSIEDLNRVPISELDALLLLVRRRDNAIFMLLR